MNIKKKTLHDHNRHFFLIQHAIDHDHLGEYEAHIYKNMRIQIYPATTIPYVSLRSVCVAPVALALG